MHILSSPVTVRPVLLYYASQLYGPSTNNSRQRWSVPRHRRKWKILICRRRCRVCMAHEIYPCQPCRWGNKMESRSHQMLMNEMILNPHLYITIELEIANARDFWWTEQMDPAELKNNFLSVFSVVLYLPLYLLCNWNRAANRKFKRSTKITKQFFELLKAKCNHRLSFPLLIF